MPVIVVSNLPLMLYSSDQESLCSFLRPIKQNEDDIAVCECKYDANYPDSACGERCLNVLTSTECIPGYCPCGDYCKNQVTLRLLFVSVSLLLVCGLGM